MLLSSEDHSYPALETPMEKFIEHLVAGSALTFLGFWHTFNIVRAYYISGSVKFATRCWYSFKSPVQSLETLELIIVLSFSISAIFAQFLDFPSLHFSFRLENFEHATMFLHLAIFSGFSLFAELNQLSETLSGVSRILAASVFGQELFLLHYHSTDHIGIEGHYHWLLQIVVSVTLLASLVVAFSPSSFPAALFLSVSISLQGCWFIVMGFMLWVPKFVPQGCVTQLNIGSSSSNIMQGAVICMNQEAEFRAKALANLQLSWVLSAILICVAAICLAFSRTREPRGKSTDYEKLQCPISDASIALTGLKQTFP